MRLCRSQGGVGKMTQLRFSLFFLLYRCVVGAWDLFSRRSATGLVVEHTYFTALTGGVGPFSLGFALLNVAAWWIKPLEGAGNGMLRSMPCLYSKPCCSDFKGLIKIGRFVPSFCHSIHFLTLFTLLLATHFLSF